MLNQTIFRTDYRQAAAAVHFREDEEALRLVFLEHIRSLMSFYVKAGYIHRSRPRVDRAIIVRIIVDQDDTVCFEDCLECLLVLVAYSLN